jgi:hypothetical protein
VPRPEPSTGGRNPWRASYKLPERGHRVGVVRPHGTLRKWMKPRPNGGAASPTKQAPTLGLPTPRLGGSLGRGARDRVHALAQRAGRVIGFCHHQVHRIVTVAVWKQSTHSDECLVDLPQPLDVGNAYPGRQVRRSRLRSEKVVHGPIPHYVQESSDTTTRCPALSRVLERAR